MIATRGNEIQMAYILARQLYPRLLLSFEATSVVSRLLDVFLVLVFILLTVVPYITRGILVCLV